MRLKQTFSTATLAAVLLAGVALAPAAGHAQTDGDFLMRQEADQMLVGNVLGIDVVGAAGENIGNVDDVVADREGQILGVVVGVGGFLGIAEKDVGIPVDALTFDMEDVPDDEMAWGWGTGRVNRVVVDYTREELEAAPEFRRFED